MLRQHIKTMKRRDAYSRGELIINSDDVDVAMLKMSDEEYWLHLTEKSFASFETA